MVRGERDRDLSRVVLPCVMPGRTTLSRATAVSRFGTFGGPGTSLAECVPLEWPQWLAILKQYGPVVGLLLAFIFWQARWINTLLDRHEKAYTGEIDRMHQQMNRLLTHVLGPQPSSGNTPTVQELVEGADQPPRLGGDGPVRSGGKSK